MRGPGADTATLVAGSVVQGSASQTVLIRAVGTILAQCGVSNFLTNPMLTLFGSSSQIVTANAAGQSFSAMSSAAALAGAFPVLVGPAADQVLW